MITALGLMILGQCSTGAGAVRYNIEHLTTEDGLPDNAVIAMTQTRDGYLWLGTLEGLVRFDGRRFTVFNEDNTPELASKEIVSLFEDSRSNLWAGTRSVGVMLIKSGRVQTLPFAQGGYERRLVAACEDAGGAVWLYAADGRLARVKNGELAAWSTFASYPSNCRVMIQEQSGLIWLGMDRALFALGANGELNPAAPPLVQQEILPEGKKLDYLLASRTGGLWRFADGQIQKWTASQLVRNVAPYPWKTDKRISAACEDAQGNLVTGTLGDGIFMINPEGKVTHFSTSDGLSSDSILSVLVDREGVLWVGTDGGGLNRIKREVFETLPAAQGSTVQSVTEDATGGVWIGFNIFGPQAAGVGLWKDGALQSFGPEPACQTPQ